MTYLCCALTLIKRRRSSSGCVWWEEDTVIPPLDPPPPWLPRFSWPCPESEGGVARYPAIPSKHKAIDYSYTYSAIGCLAGARHYERDRCVCKTLVSGADAFDIDITIWTPSYLQDRPLQMFSPDSPMCSRDWSSWGAKAPTC